MKIKNEAVTTPAAVVQSDMAGATVKVNAKLAPNAEIDLAAISAELTAKNKADAADAAEKALKKAASAMKKADKKSEADDKIAAAKKAVVFFKQLVTEREGWEQNAYKTSNDQLYALLQKCYGFYNDMAGSTAAAAGKRDGLNRYIEQKGYNFASATHTLTKIVKCVFGVDRRRVSAYGIALRFALDSKVAVQDLPAFIYDNGGVEQMRLAKSTTAMTVKQKAEVAQEAVSANTLAVVTSADFANTFDAGKIGKHVVLIGTWQQDGSVIARAVVQNDGVVNAALASYYSANKEAVKGKKVEMTAANDDRAAQEALELAVLEA
ncbi:hypothetical protein [Rhodoferax fermentans]|uniref:Uncharacterized protein n=1 Tax=Rhodoferax fermentans TaxID=28066 RepID=A0A1T1AS72_RHOFE|nr:hypothetical protein [Rhodoferax fermentans]MBK1683699.1 hypothetical protein [Rhodoferax fermentans]OOV06907.1 hypothetical protein RF819_09330 [Rhodoferax fermentans]